MKYDVFISYRQKSGIHQADALESKLKFKLNGCRVFLDRTGIKSGNWKKELDENIRESCNFVVIISKDCFPYTKKGKDYFLDEIDQALRQGKNVIPVYYDGMSYDDIKEYLSGIEDFHNQQHIIFNNNNTDGSVDQIIKFLKTEKEILNKRYKSLSKERTTVRQELMLLEEDKTDSKCPVCATSYTAEMIYCHNCGYKFFDDLEKAVANSNEKLQERGRLKIHKELWRNCQSDNKQNNTELNQELSALKTRLQVSESKREELEKQLEGIKEQGNAPAMGKETLEFWLNDKVSFKMIFVEGGSFQMGALESDSEAGDDEKPQHWVELHDYYIGETVVTQAMWKAVMKCNPSHFKGDLNLPVEKVAWEKETEKSVSVKEFIRRLNNMLHEKGQLPEGSDFRLPTEAEWEYAARGGQKGDNGYIYSGSNNIDEVAWYYKNSGDGYLPGSMDIEIDYCRTHPVKKKNPNELGLYDMSGNVWEWCEDWYDEKYYSSSPDDNPRGPQTGSYRVLRGGSWSSFARGCRVSRRYDYDPGLRNFNIGFRLVLPQ